MQLTKIIMTNSNETLELPEEECHDDASLIAALSVAYPNVANASFKREEKDGVKTIRVYNEPGKKGRS